MQTNLNEFYKETGERYYKRLVSIYTKRMNSANDKAYTHEEFSRYCGALLAFKYENSYRTRIVDHFEHDYKIGKDISLSLKSLRKDYKPEVAQSSIDFFEIDTQGEAIESSQNEVSVNDAFDLSKCSDIDLLRMFSEYTAYKRFSEYLGQEKTNYDAPGSIIGNAEIHTESLSSATKDFTTARQVLAVHYLLKYANVKNVDRTEIARFIQFLTGKNFDNIYKRLQNPFKVNDKALTEDLRFVRSYFERLKMLEVVKMINNELDS